MRWLRHGEIRKDNLCETKLSMEREGERDDADDENLEGRSEDEGENVGFCRRQSREEEEGDAGALGAMEFRVV